MNKNIVKRVMYGSKFKTNILAKYFVLPISDKNAVLGSILSEVLLNSSREYKTIEEINRKQEDLYGSVLYFDMNKFADKLIFEAKMVFPSNSHLECDFNIAKEAEKFFHEILYNPNIKDGLFDQKVFDNEKQNLILEFSSLEKNISGYAHRRLVECVYGSDALGVYKYGSKRVAKNVTNKELSDFYHNVLMNAETYTYYHGAYEDHYEINTVKNNVHSTRLDRTNFEKYVEKKDNNQSIFTRAYYFDIDFNTKDQYAAALLSIIIGGGSNSVLFNEVRERMNLCYYIYTIYDKFRNMMFLNLGMESKNYDVVAREIDGIISNIDKYIADESNITKAKTQFINSLKSLEDAQLQSIDYIFLKDLFGLSDDITDRIEKINDVSAADIIRVSKKMHKNTEFYLEGVPNEDQ